MLVSTIELLTRARRGKDLGINGAENLRLDWRAVIERKDRIVASWSKGKEAAPEKLGTAVLRGKGVFAGPHEIAVDGRTYSAEKIIIATGSRPARPPLPGAEIGITSDELIHLKEQPHRLVVVGGGFIGLEFGFALAWAGSKVTILQSGPQVAPALDDEIREILLNAAGEAGMTIVTNVKVKAIAADKTVEAEAGGAAQKFPADQVLLATGRPSNVEALRPQVAGVELDRSAVRVNEYLQSVSASHVYAVGDAAGKHQHSPVAWYEGPIAAQNALKGNDRKVDFTIFPSAIFTIPAVGQVGLTEKEALTRGLKAKVSRMPFDYNPAAGVRNETEGMVKVVYEEGTERILGVHVIGARAEDLVQIGAAAMRGGLKKSEVGAMHYVFPTLGGAIFDAMAA
ncbi:MAG: NAD(P)/FAD-dependent oxidoreductase [Deltaproteobacteria bacterium]|nr:NAD(P)/FAD-dependent oxidoreductase [Deltaproteobacteria bacterium]